MPVIQIIIDDSTSKIITGTYEFDRTNGGTLMVPSGSAFPGTPVAKELFWRTDESKLYRRDDGNLNWVAVLSAVAAHASTHNAGGSDALAIDAVAGTGSLRTLGTAATAACAGNDARLSDARTPTAHAASHQNAGADEIATATAAANAIPKANASGKLVIGWLPTGTTSSTVCIGNDSRLSNSRTPTAHAASHKSGGSDAIKLDEFAACTDVTTLNVSTAAHGLTPKLPNDAAKFLDGTGAWTTPAGSSSTYKQTQSAELSVDASTTSASFVDLLSITLTTVAGTSLVVLASIACSHNNNLGQGHFRLLVDAVAKAGAGETASGAAVPMTVALVERVTGLAAGSHTVKLQWKCPGPTLRCRPVTAPDTESCCMIVEEVGV